MFEVEYWTYIIEGGVLCQLDEKQEWFVDHHHHRWATSSFHSRHHRLQLSKIQIHGGIGEEPVPFLHHLHFPAAPIHIHGNPRCPPHSSLCDQKLGIHSFFCLFHSWGFGSYNVYLNSPAHMSLCHLLFQIHIPFQNLKFPSFSFGWLKFIICGILQATETLESLTFYLDKFLYDVGKKWKLRNMRLMEKRITPAIAHQ